MLANEYCWTDIASTTDSSFTRFYGVSLGSFIHPLRSWKTLNYSGEFNRRISLSWDNFLEPRHVVNSVMQKSAKFALFNTDDWLINEMSAWRVNADDWLINEMSAWRVNAHVLLFNTKWKVELRRSLLQSETVLTANWTSIQRNKVLETSSCIRNDDRINMFDVKMDQLTFFDRATLTEIAQLPQHSYV